jgi:hypothetical protein
LFQKKNKSQRSWIWNSKGPVPAFTVLLCNDRVVQIAELACFLHLLCSREAPLSLRHLLCLVKSYNTGPEMKFLTNLSRQNHFPKRAVKINDSQFLANPTSFLEPSNQIVGFWMKDLLSLLGPESIHVCSVCLFHDPCSVWTMSSLLLTAERSWPKKVKGLVAFSPSFSCGFWRPRDHDWHI